jgi:hypothetical protein
MERRSCVMREERERVRLQPTELSPLASTTGLHDDDSRLC